VIGYTHLISGIVAGYTLGFNLEGIAVCAFASILPDIDHRRSMISKRIPFIHRFFKHRGVTHHPLTGILIGATLHSWPFMAGYLIHLGFDAMTLMGIPLWNRKRLRGPIRTGSIAELFVLIAFILLCVSIVVYVKPWVGDCIEFIRLLAGP
jgi:membrane-bound metal-dependent hydrolase YbcI (DUF457 family)